MAEVAEVLAGVGIIISLIFVGLQLQDNTVATRSAAASASNASVSAWYNSVGNESQASALLWRYLGNPESLTAEERYQAELNIHGLLLNMQTNYFLSSEGVLYAEINASIVGVLTDVRELPGFQRYWERRKRHFSDAFQEFVDTTLAASDSDSQTIYESLYTGEPD